MEKTLFKAQPHLVEKVWGGDRLGPGHSIGESWVVSNHPLGQSLADGCPLSELFSEKELPYLIKYIHTTDNLSIQVHPDDTFAKTHEQSQGKSECWIILEAKEGAGVYLGLKKSVTHDDFLQALKGQTKIADLLNFYPLKRGDFVFVPAGTPHAIGKGLLLLEVQQSSGLTYRIWDWGRPRELHLEKALKVIDFQASPPEIKDQVLEHWGEQKLVEHPQFSLKCYKTKKNEETHPDMGYHRVASLILVKGELRVQRGDEHLKLTSNEVLVVDYKKSGQIQISSLQDSEFLWVY